LSGTAGSSRIVGALLGCCGPSRRRSIWWRIENFRRTASAIPVNGYRLNLDESAVDKHCLVFEPHVVVRVRVKVQYSVELHRIFLLQQSAVSRDRVVVEKTIEILRLKVVVLRFRLARKRVLTGNVVVDSHSRTVGFSCVGGFSGCHIKRTGVSAQHSIDNDRKYDTKLLVLKEQHMSFSNGVGVIEFWTHASRRRWLARCTETPVSNAITT
jgi:hypothetical protein